VVSQVTTESSNGHSAEPEPPVEPGPGSAVAPPPSDAAGRPPLTETQKRILAVAIVVHAVIAVFTLRDLRRRPAAGVRGPKLLWGAWATLNTTGSLAYWLVGRRPSGPGASV
jgi:hypothetical protein